MFSNECAPFAHEVPWGVGHILEVAGLEALLVNNNVEFYTIL